MSLEDRTDKDLFCLTPDCAQMIGLDEYRRSGYCLDCQVESIVAKTPVPTHVPNYMIDAYGAVPRTSAELKSGCRVIIRGRRRRGGLLRFIKDRLLP